MRQISRCDPAAWHRGETSKTGRRYNTVFTSLKKTRGKEKHLFSPRRREYGRAKEGGGGGKTSGCIQNLSRIESLHFFALCHLCPRKILPGCKSVAHKAAALDDYLSGSSWHSTVSAVPWTTSTIPYLGIQFIISYLVSPTNRL